MRIRSFDMVHPIARETFQDLQQALRKGYSDGATPTLFAPFETYRSPVDQEAVLKAGTSKVGPFYSAHQYGLAVDFVPFNGGKWDWAEAHDWKYLAGMADAHGLTTPIPWDKGHVEHPLWRHISKLSQWWPEVMVSNLGPK